MAPGEVKILNSDGVLHNIHTFSTANPPINKAQPKFMKVIKHHWDKPEMVKLACDVHNWMNGWVVVAAHSTAVTDDKGTFKIDNVPQQAQGGGGSPGARQADQGGRGQGRAGHQGRVRAEK